MGKASRVFVLALMAFGGLLGGVALALPGVPVDKMTAVVIPPAPEKLSTADLVLPAPMAPKDNPETVVLPTDGGSACTTDQTIAGRSLRLYCSHPSTYRVSAGYPDGGHTTAATERSSHIAAESAETATLDPTSNAVCFHLVNGTADLPSDGGPWCEAGIRGAQ